MFSSNPLLWQEPSVIWAYGAAVLSVAVATFISHWPVLHLESAPVSLLLCAVMFSAWCSSAPEQLTRFGASDHRSHRDAFALVFRPQRNEGFQKCPIFAKQDTAV
jgi:hypothetical protein